MFGWLIPLPPPCPLTSVFLLQCTQRNWPAHPEELTKTSCKGQNRSSQSHHRIYHNFMGHRFQCQQEKAEQSLKYCTASHCWCHKNNAHQRNGEEHSPGAPGALKNVLQFLPTQNLETTWSSAQQQAGSTKQQSPEETEPQPFGQGSKVNAGRNSRLANQ